MTKAQQLAEEYYQWYLKNKTETGFTTCMYVIPESFIAGYTACEEEALRFCEWVAKSQWCFRYEPDTWILLPGTWIFLMTRMKPLTTAQLLELYREEQLNKFHDGNKNNRG